MYLFTYIPLLSNRPQRLQLAHILLLCFSLLMAGFIVHVYRFRLSKDDHKPNNKLFALKLDRRPEPTFEQKFSNLIKEQPGLPLEFLRRNGYSRFKVSKGCAEMPNLFLLDFYNNYWQTYEADNLLVRLYGAYYDNRFTEHSTPVVRLLAMINQTSPPISDSFCQMWFEGTTSPRVVRTLAFEPIWQSTWGKGTKEKLLYPFMVICTAGKFFAPKAVSLVGRPCENAGNLLRVHYESNENKAPKRSFSVCVKGLSHPFSDLSSDLIEWLEIMYQLYIDKIHFNVYDVHPNVEKVLNFYNDLGYINFTRTTVGNVAIALPLLQHALLQNDALNRKLHEAIFAHDCFYRNMYNYEYIAYMDIDVVPAPISILNSWPKILEHARRKSTCRDMARICVQSTRADGEIKSSVEKLKKDNDFKNIFELNMNETDTRFRKRKFRFKPAIPKFFKDQILKKPLNAPFPNGTDENILKLTANHDNLKENMTNEMAAKPLFSAKLTEKGKEQHKAENDTLKNLADQISEKRRLSSKEKLKAENNTLEDFSDQNPEKRFPSYKEKLKSTKDAPENLGYQISFTGSEKNKEKSDASTNQDLNKQEEKSNANFNIAKNIPGEIAQNVFFSSNFTGRSKEQHKANIDAPENSGEQYFQENLNRNNDKSKDFLVQDPEKRIQSFKKKLKSSNDAPKNFAEQNLDKDVYSAKENSSDPNSEKRFQSAKGKLKIDDTSENFAAQNSYKISASSNDISVNKEDIKSSPEILDEFENLSKEFPEELSQKNISKKFRVSREAPNFLAVQVSDKRTFRAKRKICWYSTNFAILLDENDDDRGCSYDVETDVAQMIHYPLMNENPTENKPHSKLTFFKGVLKRRVEEVTKVLNLK